MRLICPNCKAEYEVDASLLPPEGRDVQCSNCNHTWFHPAAEAGETSPSDPEPQGSKIDEDALDVIREEVDRETKAREAEAENLETQTDMGLEGGEAETSSADDRLARRGSLPQAADDVEEDSDDALEAALRKQLGSDLETSDASSKSEIFPDIDEINSTLTPGETETPAADVAAEAAAGGSGFRLGFAVIIIFVAILLGIYAYAPTLAEMFPSMADPLQIYVLIVNDMRLWLDATAQALLEKITALIGEMSGG
ncbi:MAG: zinc-ribbon domain-containing protein [Paracoccaceae bacterium]